MEMGVVQEISESEVQPQHEKQYCTFEQLKQYFTKNQLYFACLNYVQNVPECIDFNLG